MLKNQWRVVLFFDFVYPDLSIYRHGIVTQLERLVFTASSLREILL